jgi:2-polyprenyl-6-methoxyphenol hydroxylase-like FAD-dependent oxidoreductase
MSKKHIRVVIAGASVTGLTLANMLESAGIDYVLLEAGDQIAPQVGASIALAPPALRILDQLGLYEKIKDLFIEPVTKHTIRGPSGEVWFTDYAHTIHMEKRSVHKVLRGMLSCGANNTYGLAMATRSCLSSDGACCRFSSITLKTKPKF